MERRAAGALLALAACFACSAAAPTASNQTSLDLYEGAPEGCYYNFQHYGEGDRIMTNEPCLNCTCHNRMLMCYLRVCPFTKAIGQDCTVEKRADQCCPIVTCPDVPVDLLTSTSTTSPAEYGATGLGKLDKYGCSINGKYFPEGSKVPPTPNKPCEHCYCIRNMTTCVMQECTLHVDGCTPIYHKDVCCPVRYSCDHLEDEMPLLDDMSTTVRPTPGFLLTTTTISPVTQMTQDCVHDDQIFADGALIKTEKACEHCYCMKGDIVCVVQECGAPMENEGKNCTSLPPREGQCCPDTYICEGDELSSEIPIEATTESVMEMITTLLPPRRVGVEGSGYRNEPDEAPYTAIPTIDTEIEGSGEDQDTSKPEEGLETIPPTEDGEQFISVTKAPMFDEHKHSSTESDKNVEDQTLEPHDNVATTISSIEKGTEKPVTDEVTVELKPHEHYTTTSTEKVSTEYGEFLNTVPDEVSEVDDTKSQAERTTSEPTIEGSGSPSLTENEESRTTVTLENQEVVTIAAVTSGLEYNTPAVTPETMTEKESSVTDKDILRTTVAKVEEYTEKSERESSTPEPLIPSSTNVPVEENIKLTTEPDHAENTVAVAEEEITESHISKVTGVPDSYVEGEKTTVPNVEQELATEKSVKDEVLRPSELIPTASTTLEENELSTEEPDKGLNTIPNEVHEESTSAVPHLIDTKTTEPASQDVDLKQTTSLETITLTPEIMVTKGDQYTVTTEPSFRKEDEIIVSTKKPIDFVSTTVRPEFVDEGLIPTSTHDERIGSSSETTSIEEDMTTLIPEYTKEEEGSKQTTSEFIPDISVVTESVPVKHSEPSVGQEGETVSSTEKSTETTAIVVDDVETHEEPSRIPGEGDCLLNGVTYRNNSVVPSTNNCHTGCRCASSIIKCDPIICSPPPDYMDNCQSIYDSPDSCCPTYVCDHPRETVPPQSDNQMSGTESPLSSPTIECRGDQCEISEPHKPSTDRSEPCTGGSCSGETDHKLEMPHTSATCENEKDCKSLDIPVQEVTPCEGDSCKKIDCTGDNCDPNAIFVPDHTSKIPQDIPEHDCTEEPCRRKETSDTNAKIPSECDGPNCISETDIGVQDVVYSSTKSSIPMEEVTEKIEVALEEKTTTVPESPTKDTQELDSYTTEKQLYTMMPSKEEPEDSEDVDTKKPMGIDDEVTEKPKVSHDADKETPIDTKETMTEKPSLVDEDIKLKPTDADEEVTYKPALTDDDEKRTSDMVDEITEKPTVTDEDSKAKPTVIEPDVTEKPALTDEDGKQKPSDTQERVTDLPALTDDGEKGSFTEIEEEITEKPSLIDDDGKVKPPVIDEDITEKPVHIDDEVKENPTEINEEVTAKPTLTDEDDKIKSTVIDEEVTEKPTRIDDDKLKPTVIDEEVTEKPALIDDDSNEKPSVIDEEVTKKPALSGDDEITSTDIIEQVTDIPALTEADRKVTSVSAEVITAKPAIAEDDKHKPAVSDEDITDKPDLIDQDGKVQPTVIDVDVTGKPDMIAEDGKIKPTVIDEDVTDKPDLTDDDGRRKPTDTEEKITEKPSLIDEHDKVQPTVIDEDVTGKPDFIDEDGKVKPTVIDEDVTGEPNLIDEDGKVKPTVIDEDVTDKPDLINEDGKVKPTFIDEDVTGKPDLIDEDGKSKPTIIDEDVSSKPHLIDEDNTSKPTVIDEDVTRKPDLIDEDGKAKPTVIDEEVTDIPALTDDDGRRKPTEAEEKITEKPTSIDKHEKVQPTVIDEHVTDKPVQFDEDGKEKPTDTDKETTQKPILINDDGIIIPTVIDEDVTQKPALIDDGKQTPFIQEELTGKPVESDDDGKITSTMADEKPILTDEDGKIKPTFIDEDVTDKPADIQEKVTEIPALIDDDGKGSSTGIEEEVTEKPALIDDEGKIKPPVIDEDITEKPIQTDEDGKYKPSDADEKETETPVLIDDDSKGTSPAMEDNITERPAITDINVKETYTAIQEEVTEKSTLTDDNVKEKPTEIDVEVTDKPTLTDEDSKVKPTVSAEEITKKPASIDDDSQVKPTDDERVTDESINEVTKTPPTVTEEESGTKLSEIERTKPETEAPTPEISVYPTETTTSESQEVTKTPYHESSTTLAAEDEHAFSTESYVEPADVSTSAPKESVSSESQEIGEGEYVSKIPTQSQQEPEVTTEKTYESTPNLAVTSDQAIEKETYDTTSSKQDIEEKPTTQASKLHDETELIEITTKPTIGELEETSTDIPDLESLTTRKQEGGPVEIEPQEGPADDKHKQPESGSIDDEITTKMYDEGKIKPVPESHVTEQAMAVTPAYDNVSDLPEQPVQVSKLPEIQENQKVTPEIPDSDKTKDEEYVTEKDKTITETPISSAAVTTEQHISLETQKVSDEGTLTTIKSYLPETGSTELPDKAIGEDLEHSTQTSEAHKDKPDILTDATEEPISVVTGSQEMFPASEKDIFSHGDKITSVPDVTDQIHKGTTPMEEYTQEPDGVTKAPQYHVTTEETHSKAPDTYITDEYVTGYPESSTKSDGLKEVDSETIPTEITRTSEKTEETTQPGILFTESHDHGMKEPSVTEMQEQSTKLPITSEDLETKQPGLQLTSESPQSLVTEHSETTTSIFKEDSHEPELVTTQVLETTKATELPVSVSVQEELQTEAPVSMTEHGVKETATEITEEIGKVTKVPEETVTEKQETLTTLRESSFPSQEEQTEKPQVDTKPHETTESQAETSETTTDLIILEEHTHKIVQDITTELPTENEVTDKTGDISTLSSYEEHTPKVTEHISSESPIDEERTTVHSDIEHQYPELTTEKTPEKEIEVATKETEVEVKPSEETPIEEGVTEKVLDTVAIEETTVATVQDADSKYTVAQKEYTTSAPIQISEETTPESITEPAITSVSETDIIGSSTKQPSVTEKPTHETTVPEDEIIFSTTKATTVRQGEEISDDKVAKPEDRPTETSEVPPTSTTAEVQKPSITDTQPTEKIPEPEEEFPSMGPNGYGEPDYVEEDQAFGPGTCRYGGKVYVSAQQIPRDDPCDFCFCFRSDIICLQQSCPPPIHGCHEEPIQGFCCPRYECPVSMATTVNVTTTTTTTTTTLPPHFPTHSYKGQAQRRGCQIKGHTYKVGEVVRSSSGPCLHCTCGGDGQMKCDPKACTPEPMLRQMIAAAVSAKRRR